jgi:serine protease Do
MKKGAVSMTHRLDRGKKRGILILALGILVILLAGAGMTEFHLLGRGAVDNFTEKAHAGEAEPNVSSKGIIDFSPLAKKLKPVVVNISTTQLSQNVQPPPSPFGRDDPSNEFWRRFFGNPGPSRRQSLGSGFIIDAAGYILTNNHVVDNAEKITVKLSDGGEFEAQVVGKDPKTDIALIKVEPKQNLPVAPLGDSDRLEVGEWVLAIGNPFGLDSTVTSGIVSAKGRHIGAGPYDSFIQTDASINPGNSGGPLINMRGEVVGINTAIFSQSGGNIGIGFATPINLVKEILPELKGSGKVTRGWLGVVVQRMTPDISESLGLDRPRGALVAQVANGGPAEHAGIKAGDVIIEYDGKEIKEAGDLPILVARTAPQKQVRVKLLRERKETSLTVTVGELQEEGEKKVASAQDKEKLGLTVQPMTPQLAESLGLKRPDGVVITAVEPGSPGGEAGLQKGDIILEINRVPVRNLADYSKAVANIKKGNSTLFFVQRAENTMFLTLKL